MSDGAGTTTLCPSAPAEAGAMLIGVVGPDGRIARLGTPLEIDADFVAKVKATGSPERHFRFSAPCQEGKCQNWTDGQCGLVGALQAAASGAGLLAADTAARPCPIRAACRWWRQRGRAACDVCAFVVTDNRPGDPAQLQPG